MKAQIASLCCIKNLNEGPTIFMNNKDAIIFSIKDDFSGATMRFYQAKSPFTLAASTGNCLQNMPDLRQFLGHLYFVFFTLYSWASLLCKREVIRVFREGFIFSLLFATFLPPIAVDENKNVSVSTKCKEETFLLQAADFYMRFLYILVCDILKLLIYS